MPLDYRIDVQNPFFEGLKGMQMAQEMAMRSEQLQIARAARQRQIEMQDALARFSNRQGKTMDDYRRMMTLYPELSQQIQQSMAGFTEEQRQGKVNRLLPIYASLKSGNFDVANELLGEEISAARYSQDPNELNALQLVKKNLETDPRGALTSARLFLYGAMGEDKFAAMDKQLYENEMKGAGANLRMSELLPDKTMVGITEDGNIIVKDITGKQLYGDEAKAKVEEALQRGIDLRAEAARAETEARASVGQAKDISEQVFNIMKGQSATDEAIRITQRAIDKGEWTGTGPINKFLPRMSKTSQELQSIANRMGLAELSQVTMGALSEKELEFIQAASFPEAMRKEDLLVWLKNKKAANQKMADILTDISIRIGRPDPQTGQTYTMGDWLRDRRQLFNQSVIDENVTAGISEPSILQQQAAPAIKEKYGGLPVITTQEGFNKLPKGTSYYEYDDNGNLKRYRKP